MTYARLTIIVPAASAPLARSLAAHLTGSASADVWRVGLSPTGQLPATHFVSSGAVGSDMVPVLTDAAVLHAMVMAALDTGMEMPANVGVTLADCESLVAESVVVDIDEEAPLDTLERLGLKRIQGGIL